MPLTLLDVQRTQRLFVNSMVNKEMQRPRVTEDPTAIRQQVKAAKQAAGVGIPKVPQPPVKQRAQTVKEKLEAARQNVADQRIGPPVKKKTSMLSLQATAVR